MQAAIHGGSAPVTSIQILEAAVKGGITQENIAVVKEIVAMRREEIAFENKVSFNRAFFAVKKEIAGMDFYADKEATTKGGAVAYRYTSEKEIASKLEPVLFKHGFAMMFGQRQESDRVVAEITLVHEDGHEERREYSVRTGQTNQMKDATAVDSGSTTTAWRHLVIKLFGLKSRMSESDDAHLMGEKIPPEKAEELKRLVRDNEINEALFLKFAGAKEFEDIPSLRLAAAEEMLHEKIRRGKAAQ